MKMPSIFQKRKYRAATAARRADADYAEPNMKLSSAFVVVLVLHVVAIGGIYAFSSIKAHQPADPVPVRPSGKSETEETDLKPSIASTGTAKIHRVKSGDTLTRIAAANGVSMEDLEEANGLKNVGGLRVGQELKIPIRQAARPVPEPRQTAAPLKDSGENYTVVKGDNPVLIAKKLHVGYDDLLKLNKIDDPKKLQIGQKLRIPAKHKTDVATAQ